MSHRQEGLVTVGLAWLQMPNKPPRKASGDKAPGPLTPCHFFSLLLFLFLLLNLSLGSWARAIPYYVKFMMTPG